MKKDAFAESSVLIYAPLGHFLPSDGCFLPSDGCFLPLVDGRSSSVCCRRVYIFSEIIILPFFFKCFAVVFMNFKKVVRGWRLFNYEVLKFNLLVLKRLDQTLYKIGKNMTLKAVLQIRNWIRSFWVTRIRTR